MKFDKYDYILESNAHERNNLLRMGIAIHLKGSKTQHIAKCNRNIRSFLTRDKDQVTCIKCRRD